MIQRKNGLNIVCISPAPWDYPIWTNRQHIMARVAQKHNVIYVFHSPFLRSSIKRNISIKNSKIISMFKRVNDHLLVFTPFVLPFSREFLFIHRLNIKISATFLKKKLKHLGLASFILWFYDPEAVYYLDYMKPMLSCYDCVDEYSSMPFYSSKKWKKRLTLLERSLVEKCDLVFTTSINLYKKKKIENQNTFLVENVGDFEHFSKAQLASIATPSDYPKVNKPVIGFVGALDNYKVDNDLIRYLAERKGDWSIVLIGGLMNSQDSGLHLSKRDNIHYLGRKSYKSLPAYLSQFDVCMIPYRINDYTRHVFPIKLFEFLATGKPVVTTALPSLSKYQGIAKVANSYQDFLRSIEESIVSDSQESKARRIELAKRNTWAARAGRLLSHVFNVLEGKRV